MKKYNLKEAGTWAGFGIVLGNMAGVAVQYGSPKMAAVFGALSAICGAVAGFLPENKLPVIK
jgi:outer membrane lipoprotein SlyB